MKAMKRTGIRQIHRFSFDPSQAAFDRAASCDDGVLKTRIDFPPPKTD